jgi:hypothetical protein
MPLAAAECDQLDVGLSPRHVKVAALLVATVMLAASAAFAKGSPRISFVRTAGRVLQGNFMTASVSAPSGTSCGLSVRYANGAKQAGLKPARAAGGQASWTWHVALATKAGPARMTASCGHAGRATRTLIVVGQLVAPKITVVRDGWSVHYKPFGGVSISYGVILKNHSPNADALNVNVLVNFVEPNNHLFASSSRTVNVIPAGADYALGYGFDVAGVPPIARLEVVIQVGARQPKAMRVPAVDNVVIEPSSFDPSVVGDIAGELINDDPKLVLQSAQMSAVVFDAAGNVLGGGNGTSFNPLPPGTRMIFKLQSGFGAIPTDKAASVVISIVPNWRLTGP